MKRDGEKHLQYLLNAGADANSVNEEGRTLTMKATVNGNTKWINVLLNSGANVNKVDPKGFTSLMLTTKVDMMVV